MFYYSSDGKTFKSKIDALSHQLHTGSTILFYYYDNIYSKLDWTIEPPESLDYYYKEQAQRIRDSYDYVILCYSGGYDSSNILETFYYNNIKLDKIVTVGALKQDSHSNVDENHNGELYHNVFPYLKELELDNITQVIDYSELFSSPENLSILKFGENWVDQLGGWFSPHNWFWYDLERYVIPPAYADKKVAIIFGRDKPSLYTNSLTGDDFNGFYFRDTPVTSYGNVSGQGNCDRINFYWDPTYPNILLKQLHVLYRYRQQQKKYFFDHDLGAYIIGNLSVNDLVYSLKRKILFKSKKSSTNKFSLRDAFLLNKKDSEVFKIYQQGMNYIEERTQSSSRLLPVVSRFYKIV
jgi:hypothetical protein